MASYLYLGNNRWPISGLPTLTPGSIGPLNLGTDRRYHKLNLQTQAVAYQNPQVYVFSGTGVKVGLTLNAAGQITAATVSGTLANYNTGAGQVILYDPAGTGTGGVVSINFTAANAATATVVNPGIGYSRATVALVVGPAGTGNTAPVVTPTVTNGVITALAITSAGTGTPLNATAANNTALIVDAPYNSANGYSYLVGQGATATVTGVTTQTLTGITLGVGGTIALTPAELVLQRIQEKVNGTIIRDTSVAALLRRIAVNPGKGFAGSVNPSLRTGELPLYYTEPWRTELQHDETTSWDMLGQTSFEIDFQAQSNVTSPGFAGGSYDWDLRRNSRPDGKGGQVPFLNPVAMREFTLPVPGGQFDINTLPVSPGAILRLWLKSISAGALSSVELLCFNNIIMQQTAEQYQEAMNEYGFNPNVFDGAYIADPDMRLYKAVTFSADSVPANMILRIVTAQAGSLSVLMETLPGAYR